MTSTLTLEALWGAEGALFPGLTMLHFPTWMTVFAELQTSSKKGAVIIPEAESNFHFLIAEILDLLSH